MLSFIFYENPMGSRDLAQIVKYRLKVSSDNNCWRFHNDSNKVEARFVYKPTKIILY